jgi:hypothetical protein
MNLSTAWNDRKAGKKKKRSVHKPKIRWELLGLSNPDLTDHSAPIETIRLGVSLLASHGIGPETRLRTAAQGNKASTKKPLPIPTMHTIPWRTDA